MINAAAPGAVRYIQYNMHYIEYNSRIIKKVDYNDSNEEYNYLKR